MYGRSGRLYGNSNGKLRGDRGHRDRPDGTLLCPGDQVKFRADHMETTPGDSSAWLRSECIPLCTVSRPELLAVFDTFKMASGSVNFNSALFMEEIQKYECLHNELCKDYKNKFIRLNCWKKIGEKFQATPDEAEKKYKYIHTSYGRWLKKRKSVLSGSGRDAVPKVPPEFGNLDWLSNHINHKHANSRSQRQ